MKTKDIWKLPVDQRMNAFIERWLDLAEYTGCRTIYERHEMADIAEAIMPELIRVYRENKID